MAFRRRRAPSTVAWAPMGTWHPPPSAASKARSAVTAACVAGWSSAAQASNPAPAARVSMRQRSLADGGAHHIRRQDFRDAAAPAEALQAGGGQQDGVVLACIELAQARIQIAAHRFHGEVRTELAQLRGAAQRAGSDPGAGGQIGQRAAHHGVARVLALGHGGQHQARGQLGGQILQAVHGEIGAAVEQGFLNLLGEQALGPDLGERHIGDLVAGGLDDFDAARKPGGGELPLHPTGLPQGKLRTARCDDKL